MISHKRLSKAVHWQYKEAGEAKAAMATNLLESHWLNLLKMSFGLFVVYGIERFIKTRLSLSICV
jgi:hypothetical protein